MVIISEQYQQRSIWGREVREVSRHETHRKQQFTMRGPSLSKSNHVKNMEVGLSHLVKVVAQSQHICMTPLGQNIDINVIKHTHTTTQSSLPGRRARWLLVIPEDAASPASIPAPSPNSWGIFYTFPNRCVPVFSLIRRNMETTCLIRLLRGLREMKAPNTLPVTIPRWYILFSFLFLNFSEIRMHPTIIAFLDLIKDDDDDEEKNPWLHSQTHGPTPHPHPSS